MDEDDELVPISALQHLLFCPRQCALIHVERQWAENRLTVEGEQFHAQVQTETAEARRGVRIERALPLASVRLRLYGIADTVEFRGSDRGRAPYPVEYKRGAPKQHDADRVQLCAQALCLEEMFGEQVLEGALFYGQPRRRERVAFDVELRARTEGLVAELHALIADRHMPPPSIGPHCRSCSLVEICRPRLAEGRSAARWLERARLEP